VDRSWYVGSSLCRLLVLAWPTSPHIVKCKADAWQLAECVRSQIPSVTISLFTVQVLPFLLDIQLRIPIPRPLVPVLFIAAHPNSIHRCLYHVSPGNHTPTRLLRADSRSGSYLICCPSQMKVSTQCSFPPILLRVVC
jgi:hypothetical protein